MVIDLLRVLAKQVIRERFDRHLSADHPTSLALMVGAGYVAADLVKAATDGLPVKQNVEAQELSSLVALGLHPARARRAGIPIKNPYRGDSHHQLSDPLHLTLFFAEFEDHSDAEAMLAERELMVENHRRFLLDKKSMPDVFGSGFWPDYLGVRFNSTTPILPSGLWKKRGLPAITFNPHLDNMYLEACFARESFEPQLARMGFDNYRRLFMISMFNDKRWVEALRKVALKNLSSAAVGSSRSKPQYPALIQDLQMCTLEDAMNIANSLDGSRACILIARDDLPSNLFVQGLRALTGLADTERPKVAAYMARAPTLDEIKQVRSKSLIYVLNEMPWELLEPLTKTAPLRQIALPHAETLSYELLQSFLIDHPGRKARMYNIMDGDSAKNVRLTKTTTIADWVMIMRNLRVCWMRSVMTRRDLATATNNDPHVAFLAMLKAYNASSPAIQDALRAHPNHEAIDMVVSNFNPPTVYEATG